MTQEALKLAQIALEDTEHSNFKRRRLDALIAIKQALAQPEQEPPEFAYVMEAGDDRWKKLPIQVYKKPWVNLTVDELIDLEHKHLSHENLVRAIEDRLRQKNI